MGEERHISQAEEFQTVSVDAPLKEAMELGYTQSPPSPKRCGKGRRECLMVEKPDTPQPGGQDQNQQG